MKIFMLDPLMHRAKGVGHSDLALSPAPEERISLQHVNGDRLHLQPAIPSQREGNYEVLLYQLCLKEQDLAVAEAVQDPTLVPLTKPGA